MAYHKDRIGHAVTVGGTGAQTLGAAVTKHRAFVAGDDARLFPYVIEDGDAWETGYGTYTHTGTSYARTTRTDSSTGSALNVTTAAKVYVTWIADLGTTFTNFISAFGFDPISVTGATTATIGRMHVCSGTTADYTVTLPAVSGNTGKFIGFLMETGLTKLVTLDGNASEAINGALTRVMWAGEAALLLCDGSNWFKIAGKTLAMTAIAAPSGNTTVADNTEVKVSLNTSIADPTGMMNDTANGRMNIKRAGTYVVTSVVRYSNISTQAARYAGGLHRTRSAVKTAWVTLAEQSALVGAYSTVSGVIPLPNNADDIMELYAYQLSGVTETAAGSGTTENSFMALEEVLAW